LNIKRPRNSCHSLGNENTSILADNFLNGHLALRNLGHASLG